MVNIRRFHDFIHESQCGDRQAILDWQREQLTALMRHARDTVPLYHFRLARLFRRDGSIDWDNWAQLPTPKLLDLQTQEVRLHSRWPVPEHGRGE